MTSTSPYVLESVTLEHTIHTALQGISPRWAPGAAGKITDAVAEGIRKYRNGDRGDNGATLEDVILRRTMDATGTTARDPRVVRVPSRVVSALREAEVDGLVMETLAQRASTTDYRREDPEQREAYLLQCVDAANRRTEATRDHLMAELRERDALVRDLQAALVDLQGSGDQRE